MKRQNNVYLIHYTIGKQTFNASLKIKKKKILLGTYFIINHDYIN